MFCQKCGKPVPDGEGKIIGNHLVCEECAQSLVKHFCQRCGKELPRGTQPQENGRLLCEACAALPDDSGADEPFRDSRKKQPAGLPMLPVWMSALILVLVAGAVGMLFATKTLCFHKWQPATCQQPEICLRCGRIHGEPLPHRWKDADCLHPRTCMLCGETEGEPLGHDWLDATCTEPQICTRCGATQGKPAGHKWEKANCQHPEQCLVCGAVRGERGDHVWREATCEEPRTCELCGETQIKPVIPQVLVVDMKGQQGLSFVVTGEYEGVPLDAHEMKTAGSMEYDGYSNGNEYENMPAAAFMMSSESIDSILANECRYDVSDCSETEKRLTLKQALKIADEKFSQQVRLKVYRAEFVYTKQVIKGENGEPKEYKCRPAWKFSANPANSATRMFVYVDIVSGECYCYESRG